MSENATIASPERPVYNRKNPLSARVVGRKHLTAGCDEKNTWHLELDLQGSGLVYEPGDSLAVFPKNCPDLVEEVLNTLGFSGEEMVMDAGKEEVSIREALTASYAIGQPDKKFLARLLEKAGTATQAAQDLSALLAPEMKQALADHLWGREVIDLLVQFPEVNWEPEEFVSVLRKLNVRLYSIASSLKAKPNECHLTVASVEFNTHGRDRKGVCSTFLNDRITEETPIPCFVTPGKAFRPPEPDDEAPIIMCGPGTGIAPFRAFMQERAASNAKGDAWLFFGEIHEDTCFFYQEEWEGYLAGGQLTKLSTAWSRDGEAKVYVQHKIKENGAELWEWLEKGAYFYVCGDAERMAPDVDRALHEVAMEHGGKSEEEAAEYFSEMKKSKRYRRDVY